MPIYEYECLDHGHRFEVLQKMSEEPIQVCKECGGKVRKMISAAGFMLKGSGWFKDGYASSKPVISSESSSSSSSETKTTETKKPESSTTVSTTPTPKKGD